MPRIICCKQLIINTVFVVCAYAPLAGAADRAPSFWHDVLVQQPALTSQPDPRIAPSKYRSIRLDLPGLRAALAAASVRRGPSYVLSLPTPNGEVAHFVLADSEVLPDSLAHRYPEILSYKGVDEQGRQLRLDVSPQGLQASVYNDKAGLWFVQSVASLSGKPSQALARGDALYWSFWRADLPAPPRFEELGLSNSNPQGGGQSPLASARATMGSTLYEYRLAVAASSSYSQKFGVTKANVLAEISRIVNRVNALYENDLGIHLTLIPDEDKIIYTDPSHDPYSGLETENHRYDLIDKNASNLKQAIGANNYDVGHLLSAAELGGATKNSGTCDDAKKGQSFSSFLDERPDISDIVAHELGHAFGARHVFNMASAGRDRYSAVEPGEGSSIMGYAGLSDDPAVFSYQTTPDYYFNSANIIAIEQWISGAGGACAKKTLNQNSGPTIVSSLQPPDGLRAVYTLPLGTAFTLPATVQPGSAAASQLTYTWEQADAGPEQTGRLTDTDEMPIFRSFRPNASAERTFPRLAAVLGEEDLGNGEIYPYVARTLSFRLTVRDNVPLSLRLGTGPHTVVSPIMFVDLVDTNYSFSVLVPSQGQVLQKGSLQTIGWDHADTYLEPIACTQVRLDLSLDGGHTYLPQPLIASTPNGIGTSFAKLALPNVVSPTNQARIKISCTNNLFFAVSDGFTIS